MIESLALSRLLQLASPMLPVGAYSYSQGLEAAIEAGTVHDAATAQAWTQDVLELYLARFELPLLWRMHGAWTNGDDPQDWNALFSAGRDTSESRAETIQMGGSLLKLIGDLGDVDAASVAKLKAVEPLTFPVAYAFAAAFWRIPASAAVQAYGWGWLENHVAVAMKTIPIGQVAGQRILMALGARLPEIVEAVAEMDDDDISNFAPGLSLAGCLHETQYSRLFRS
jgi:urease accessory protein